MSYTASSETAAKTTIKWSYLAPVTEIPHPFISLPKHWWRRFDNNPGTIVWWAEYIVFKVTGRCNHGRIGKGWIRATKDCRLAQACEYDSIFPRNKWEDAQVLVRGTGPNINMDMSPR